MNSPFDVSANVASSGFCISKKNNIYISNKYIIGFQGVWNHADRFIDILVPGKTISIYKHNSKYLDFDVISNKIITKLMDGIKYNINTNIYIDEIINEVLQDE